jgi:hypothetical protein
VDLGEAVGSELSTTAADLGGLSCRERRTRLAAAATGASLGKKKGMRKKKGVQCYL